MKKIKRRLALEAQTVANLSPGELARAAGGNAEADGGPIQPCSYRCSAFMCQTLITCSCTCGPPCGSM